MDLYLTDNYNVLTKMIKIKRKYVIISIYFNTRKPNNHEKKILYFVNENTCEWNSTNPLPIVNFAYFIEKINKRMHCMLNECIVNL